MSLTLRFFCCRFNALSAGKFPGVGRSPFSRVISPHLLRLNSAMARPYCTYGGPDLFDKNFRRLNRQFDRISRNIPISRGFLQWVRRPQSRILRIPLGILLVLGGIFSFLPVLGIWMLPLGLLLLALDMPFLQGPMNNIILRGQRWFAKRRRQRQERRRLKEQARP